MFISAVQSRLYITTVPFPLSRAIVYHITVNSAGALEQRRLRLRCKTRSHVRADLHDHVASENPAGLS